MIIHYSIIEPGSKGTLECIAQSSMSIYRPREQQQIIELCATHYANTHPDETWPKTFALHTEKNGHELARFNVFKEFEPEYCAYAWNDDGK